MFGVETDSDIVECPYNKAHRVLRKRLQIHLLKCRKNNPDAELQTCPFNVTHLIPEPEFVAHVASCPDRKIVTQYINKDEKNVPRQEEIIRHSPVDEENWDDTEAPDFKPLKLIAATAAKIKIEKKPDISKLKRERSSSPTRSRSRSPVYRSYEHDFATSSRYAYRPSGSTYRNSRDYKTFSSSAYQNSRDYKPFSSSTYQNSGDYKPFSTSTNRNNADFKPIRQRERRDSMEVPYYDLDDDPYYGGKGGLDY